MLYIITGEINSGKTTRLREIFNRNRDGKGYALIKKYINGIYIGQNIINLTNSKERIFSRIEGYIPLNWNEKYRYLNHSFNLEGIQLASDTIRDLIDTNISTAYIDELGPLEVNREGIYKDFVQLMKYTNNIYVTIRKECINEIINTFNIVDYKIIS